MGKNIDIVASGLTNVLNQMGDEQKRPKSRIQMDIGMFQPRMKFISSKLGRWQVSIL
jgi:hypothetical protein